MDLRLVEKSKGCEATIGQFAFGPMNCLEPSFIRISFEEVPGEEFAVCQSHLDDQLKAQRRRRVS